MSFQIDALSTAFDWPDYPVPRFDWLGALPIEHQDKSNLALNVPQSEVPRRWESGLLKLIQYYELSDIRKTSFGLNFVNER